MRQAATLVIMVALVFGVTALLAPTELEAGPGQGKGSCKQNNKHCLKWCGPPPAGCTYFECTKCGCDFLCGNGEIVHVP